MWYGQERPHEKVTFGQRSEGSETGMYRVWGGWGVAACIGSIPDQLYKKCKAPGRSMCLRNSSKKTSRVTVEWGRAGPVWDASKVACLWVFWFWVFALGFVFFFFGLWFDLGETVLQRDIRGAVSCHGSHQSLLLVERGEADSVCVCVTDLRIFYLQVFQNIL